MPLKILQKRTTASVCVCFFVFYFSLVYNESKSNLRHKIAACNRGPYLNRVWLKEPIREKKQHKKKPNSNIGWSIQLWILYMFRAVYRQRISSDRIMSSLMHLPQTLYVFLNMIFVNFWKCKFHARKYIRTKSDKKTIKKNLLLPNNRPQMMKTKSKKLCMSQCANVCTFLYIHN